MFLSFIVPVYNTEKYLAECLDSLLEQDIPKEDYEILCVNDGSTDGSLRILHEYARVHPNIVVVDQENGGLSNARNVGLTRAKGDYIWFVDSDDFIQLNILAYFRSVVAQTDCDRLNLGTYTFHDVLSFQEKDAARNGQLASNTYLYNIVVWNNLFRRSFLNDNNLYFRYPYIRHSEDGIFMFESTLAMPKETVVDTVGYYYRRRDNSLTTARSAQSQQARVHSYFTVSKILLQYYLEGHHSSPFLSDLLMANIWTLMYTIATFPLSKSREIRKKLREEGLYPFVRPEACTLKKSYQTTRSDLVGRTFDLIYTHMHRPWGFYSMWILQRLISLKHSFRK